MLKVYWYGYGGGSWMAEKLRYVIENKLNMKLVTIHEHPDANIKWDLNTVYEELKKADIIIIPANFKRQPCKSANRLTQAMALGKPIICDPMPSYKPVIKNLHNAIMLKNGTEAEWEFALSLLKEDSELRSKLANNALETSKNYTVSAMASKWTKLIASYEPKGVDVVIPTKDNIPIIRECLKSFSQSTLQEDVYIIDNDVDTDKLEDLIKELGYEYEIREI